MTTYDNFEHIYKHEVVQQIQLPAIVFLRDVFWFKGETMEKCRNQFIHWLSIHKQFYHDSIHALKQKLFDERNRLNQVRAAQNLFPIEYINLFPEYGGKLQDGKIARQMEDLMYEREGAQLPWHNEQLENYIEEKKERQREEKEMIRAQRKSQRE